MSIALLDSTFQYTPQREKSTYSFPQGDLGLGYRLAVELLDDILLYDPLAFLPLALPESLSEAP